VTFRDFFWANFSLERSPDQNCRKATRDRPLNLGEAKELLKAGTPGSSLRLRKPSWCRSIGKGLPSGMTPKIAMEKQTHLNRGKCCHGFNGRFFREAMLDYRSVIVTMGCFNHPLIIRILSMNCSEGARGAFRFFVPRKKNKILTKEQSQSMPSCTGIIKLPIWGESNLMHKCMVTLSDFPRN